MARSNNWRINKSSLMAVEGAQLLKALQKVAGAAGLPKGFTVKFATKSHGGGIDFDAKEVVIGAGRLFNEAPLPAEKMDVLVGLMLHEVGHERIETYKVWTRLDAVDQNEWKILQKFVNIGEDIAIESRLADNPNLVDYQNALHDWAIGEIREADVGKLLELWIEYALAHKMDWNKMANLSQEINDAMAQLVALTGWLRHEHDYTERAEAYRNYWSTLKDVVLNPPQPKNQSGDGAGGGTNSDSTESTDKPDKQDSGESEPKIEPGTSSPAPNSGAERDSSEDPEQNNNLAGTNEGDSSAPEPGGNEMVGNTDGVEDELDRPLAPKPEDAISDELAEAIEDAVQSELEDITEAVSLEFDGQNIRDTIIRSRETKTPLIKPNAELRKRLERIMTIRKRLQARTMHGEQYGRIDKRHLHRVATDERIFSLRYKFPDGFPNTRILIDLSGSMSGRQADEVLEAAGALQTLVNAEVWCYNYGDDKVNLVRMDEGKLIHRFEPDGSTPSGLAIVGVSIGMKSGGLVIHLTDGEHNHGQKPWNANWILKKRGIELVNLIWGKTAEHYNLDGINWKRLDGLAEFPEALYQILVEQVKLAKIGGKR